MRRALTAGLLLAALAAAGFAGLAALRPSAPPPDDFGPVGEFSLTERSGRTVTNANLAGKVWIASFVFTRCTGGCPQVTSTVARIQDAFRNEPDFRLVTFTVDPERDTAEHLKTYLSAFDRRIIGLTGSAVDIASVARAYHVFYEKVPTSGGYTMNHTATVFLMDRTGVLAGATNHEETEVVQLNKLRRLLTR